MLIKTLTGTNSLVSVPAHWALSSPPTTWAMIMTGSFLMLPVMPPLMFIQIPHCLYRAIGLVLQASQVLRHRALTLSTVQGWVYLLLTRCLCCNKDTITCLWSATLIMALRVVIHWCSLVGRPVLPTPQSPK